MFYSGQGGLHLHIKKWAYCQFRKALWKLLLHDCRTLEKEPSYSGTDSVFPRKEESIETTEMEKGKVLQGLK